jgi:hypothetical protein
MADAKKLVPSNFLCFVVNKIGKYTLKALKSLAMDFYTVDEVSEAKDILLKEVESLNIENFVKVTKKRRDSTGKSALEFEDIYNVLTFLDENGHLHKLPLFVATNPDKLPSPRLLEGDMEIVMNKLNKLDDSVRELLLNSQNRDITQSNTDSFLQLDSKMTFMESNIANIAERFNKFETLCSTVQSLSSMVSSIQLATDRPAGDKSLISIEGDYRREDMGANTGTARRWGSMASDSEIDTSNNGLYTLVQSKATRRTDKRKKSSSPLDQDKRKRKANTNVTVSNNPAVINTISEAPSENNHFNHSYAPEGPSYAAMTQNGVPLPKPIHLLHKTVGRGTEHTLKAAERSPRPLAVKAVYCVANIGSDFTQDDIRKHCKSLNVRVLFCFEISKNERNAKAFKVAVRDQDKNIIENCDSWPARVIIRPWRYNLLDTEASDMDSQACADAGQIFANVILNTVDNASSTQHVDPPIETVSTNSIVSSELPFNITDAVSSELVYPGGTLK